MSKKNIQIAKEVYQKLHNGDPIGDDELKIAIEVFGDIVDFMHQPELFLAWSPLKKDLMALEGYKAARKNG